ncbi:MAG: roadblock/LC7 domain-containing protein [Candidatus Asgardarchaeia archaeon]
MHLEKFDEAIRKKLQSILKKIEMETDLYEVTIVTRDGIRIASATSSTIDANENSAAVAAMLNIAQDTSRRMEQGRLIQVVVRGEKGFTIITRVSPELVLAASSRSQYKLGLYLRMLVTYAYEIASLLEKISIEGITPPTTISSKPVSVESVPLFESVEEKGESDTGVIPAPSTDVTSSGLFESIPKEHELSESEIEPEAMSASSSEDIVKIPPSGEPISVEKASEIKPTTIEPSKIPLESTSTESPRPIQPVAPTKAPNVDEEERKAIMEALRIIGMIGKKKK